MRQYYLNRIVLVTHLKHLTSQVVFNVCFTFVSFSAAVDDVKVEDLTRDNAMEAEVKAAQQRAVIPIEDRINQFKEMLAEKEVTAVFVVSRLFFNGSLQYGLGFGRSYVRIKIRGLIWNDHRYAAFFRS